MAKITLEMAKQAYILAKNVYNGKIDRNKGIEKTYKEYGLNKGNASIFINNFRCLIDGQIYKRIMSVEQTQYFLEQIFNDYEEDIFKKALYSMKKHIEYIKSIKKPSNVEQLYRELINEHNIHDEILIEISNKINRHSNKVEHQPKNKPKSAILIKKPLSESSTEIDPHKSTEQPYEIVRCAMDKITEINQNCKNHKRDPIFKQKAHELSRIIEKPCSSKEQFINFALNLYLMIYETTRKQIPNARPDYKLPYEFIRESTQTKHFMDIVGTFRHHYAHLEPEYKVTIKKISYEDALFELSKNRNEPKSKEDFQKLQNNLLKMFDDAMKKLLEIVESELNPPKTH